MRSRSSVLAAASMAALLSSTPALAVSWLGTTGDSLSEPYSEVPPIFFLGFLRPAGPGWPGGTTVPASPAPMNWVDQLMAHRSAELAVDNYAVGGSDTHTLLDQAQHTDAAAAAAAQIGAGNDAFVSIGIGTNNFLPFSILPSQINTYGGIQNGCIALTSCPTPFTGSNGLAYSAVDTYVSDVFLEFETALDTLQGSGANAVVMGPGSWSSFPGTALSTAQPANAIVDEAVDLLIQQQRAEALARGLPFVDYQALLEDFPGLTIGGLSLLSGLPAAGTRDPRHWYLPDGIHPDTIASGLLANAMILAMNQGYGAGLTPFTDAEILGFAGLAPDAGWNGISVDVTRYVTVPEPAAALLVLVAGLAAGARRRRTR